MDKYGIDKPDLRNPLIIEDATKCFEGSDFKVFKNKTIKCIKIDSSKVTRRFFDEMVKFAVDELELSGLAWVRLDENSQISGTISKFVTEEVLNSLKQTLEFKENEAIFFIADEYTKACEDAGQIRIEL